MRYIAYKEMFNQETTHAWYQSTRKLLLDLLRPKLPPTPKILDAGCGTGGTIVYLNQQAPSWNIQGIDYSKTAVTYCRRRGLTSIRLGNVNHLPFPDNYFDCVYCLDVLCQRGVNRPRTLSEFNRVLKIGGCLYIQEPAVQKLYSAHDRIVTTQKRFNRSELVSLVSPKFHIDKISYFNFLLFPLISIIRILNKYKQSHHSDVQKLSYPIQLLITVCLRIESVILRYTNLPIGITLICLAQKE